MHGQNRCLVAFLAFTFSATTAEAAEKSVISCTSGELVRRVVVEVGDINTSLPCEVVYWKDKEAPGVRRVLWNARSDPAYCDSQAAGLVDKLSTAGWSCDGSDQLDAASQTPVSTQPTAVQPSPAQPAAPVASTEPSAPSSTAPTVEVPATTEPATPAPATDVAAATLSNDLNAAAGPAPEPAAAPSNQPLTTTPEPSVASPTENVQTAALPPADTSAAAPVDQLESVIQNNLASLNQSVDGDFQAKIGDFGDLNNDGIDDAVVFFNYESSSADFTQFVAAYLYNGESYHLAATKPVGGTDLAVREVVVEDIVQGSIQLKLQLNDSSQAGDRRAAMVLKDGQLVETQ